ncbi:MAG: hypothetical protein PHR44_01315 [Candidatus Omnitrophica bacterium]|nr:hypothetical protein [Candidatus Omnitrophota bacterium]
MIFSRIFKRRNALRKQFEDLEAIEERMLNTYTGLLKEMKHPQMCAEIGRIAEDERGHLEAARKMLDILK